jgi:hypothetical protein
LGLAKIPGFPAFPLQAGIVFQIHVERVHYPASATDRRPDGSCRIQFRISSIRIR